VGEVVAKLGFQNPAAKILNTKIYDEAVRVKNDDAMDIARRMAKEEGLPVGISSGAAMWAAIASRQSPVEQRQADRGDHPFVRRALSQHAVVRGTGRLTRGQCFTRF
jgi:cysteine synthase